MIVLPDADGKEIRLGTLWEKQPAVVVFLRHYGWIFCRQHVAQLRAQEAEFKAKGAALAAVSLGDVQYAKAFREETKIDFPLLIDEKKIAYEAMELRSANLLHLLKSENFAARSQAKAEGYSQHKLGKNPFQLGGSFVFGPGDVDRYAHLSETFGDNAAMKDLLAALGWGKTGLPQRTQRKE
jgi:prostamide/prostaglandin F2alpha synthase